jgi:acetolactate synthase I/II/III large subunit
MKKIMTKGSAMIMSALEKEGVEIIFGFPGGAVLPLYNTLYDSPIRHLLVRHEQAAVHAADGYARVTGRPGVVFATSGPGRPTWSPVSPMPIWILFHWS